MLNRGNQSNFVKLGIKAINLAYFLLNIGKSFYLTYWFNLFLGFIFGLAFVFPPENLSYYTTLEGLLV